MNYRNVNYQKEMDKLLHSLQGEGRVPKLLLHSCCAPCSSYVLEYLSDFFEITVFYYNPNIYPESEYTKRLLEQQALLSNMHFTHPVSFIAGSYDKEKFYEMSEGLEHLKEGGERCHKCYELRLAQTARMAVKGGFDYFTTTLSISPMKNAGKLNEIGTDVASRYGVKYLQSDLRRRTDISGPLNCPRSTGCTGRIIADVNFQLKIKKKNNKRY